MRAAIIALAILLLPVALIAQPTVGIYFTGHGMDYAPTQWEEFNGYVLLNNFPCYVTAAEFKVTLPGGANAGKLDLVGFEVAAGSLTLGTPLDGISITYWPPLNGFEGNALLLCTLNFLAREGCYYGPERPSGGPGIDDASLSICADPNAVPNPGVLATCYPENEIHQLVGLTSIICPECIGVQDKSWGAIKALYGN